MNALLDRSTLDGFVVVIATTSPLSLPPSPCPIYDRDWFGLGWRIFAAQFVGCATVWSSAACCNHLHLTAMHVYWSNRSTDGH
jgi:hypothetical protein